MPAIRTTTRACLVGGVLALALALSACGGASAPTGAAPSVPSVAAQTGAELNDADIRFAQMMVPHHRQAVELAELAVGQAGNAEVRSLAEQIRAAHGADVGTLTGYLQAWGVEVPDDGGMGGMGGMDHSGGSEMSGMSGMTTPAEIAQLQSASGAGFDTLFLNVMIAHHEAAVAEAQRELTEGVNPQARDLATAMVSAQTAEVDRMRRLLQAG